MSNIDQDRARLLRTRRSFFRTVGGAALGSAAISSTLRDFRLINSALAQGPGAGGFNDYKALVCIFLNGGNDSNNLIVPRGAAAHANYAAIRGNLTIPETALVPITPDNNDGNEYGFHPLCTEMASLFQAGKLAPVFNVGPLLFPTTRIQYQKKLVALPPQLFSHSDQVTHWQTSLPDQLPRSGWGGRVADHLNPYQKELLAEADRAKIALCTSIAGSNTFEVGNSVQQFHVSTSGAVILAGAATGSARENVVRSIANLQNTNLQAKAFGDVIDNAIAAGASLNEAVRATSPTVLSGEPTTPWAWNTAFPSGSLGDQLKMVARIIAGRKELNIKRQIFFVTVGGYDTHTSQMGAANDAFTGSHANLLGTLSKGIAAFQAAIEQIAAHPVLGDGPPTNTKVANSVVGFTASDFGRTFPTNSQGSDHGWGGHHVVFGGNGNPATGAVIGKKTYGRFPVHQINGPDDTSTGRWIPSTSVDEYSATLAQWFGVQPAYMPTVFPNLGRFAAPDLGFMRS